MSRTYCFTRVCQSKRRMHAWSLASSVTWRHANTPRTSQDEGPSTARSCANPDQWRPAHDR
eukprot:6325117-Amphidinium_carterae.1